ncbi:MAG: fluoride efflux transporter FluC [Opitutales bacterium]
MVFLFVAIGCALGGVCRELGMTLASRLLGRAFPWGTLVVNVLGSFLLGAILGAGLVPSESAPGLERMHAFAALGYCGGLTTFSTFSLQNLTMLSKHQKGRLMANIFASVAFCLLAAVAGYSIMERWTAGCA